MCEQTTDRLAAGLFISTLHRGRRPSTKNASYVSRTCTLMSLRANKYGLVPVPSRSAPRSFHTRPFVYRSTVAWSLGARAPFIGKAFLGAAVNIGPKKEQFSKDTSQETDEGGCPRMEEYYILRNAFGVSPDSKLTLSISPSPDSRSRKTDGLGGRGFVCVAVPV